MCNRLGIASPYGIVDLLVLDLAVQSMLNLLADVQLEKLIVLRLGILCAYLIAHPFFILVSVLKVAAHDVDDVLDHVLVLLQLRVVDVFVRKETVALLGNDGETRPRRCFRCRVRIALLSQFLV